MEAKVKRICVCVDNLNELEFKELDRLLLNTPDVYVTAYLCEDVSYFVSMTRVPPEIAVADAVSHEIWLINSNRGIANPKYKLDKYTYKIKYFNFTKGKLIPEFEGARPVS